MATFKCTFRGRVGIRDEIRAEVYLTVPQINRPGRALDASEPIVLRHVPNLLIKGRSVRKVADMEHTMIRVHRFHRVLEGEVQDDGSVSPIQPLTLVAEDTVAGEDAPTGSDREDEDGRIPAGDAPYPHRRPSFDAFGAEVSEATDAVINGDPNRISRGETVTRR